MDHGRWTMHMHKQLATFIEAIRNSGLLSSEQVEEITSWAVAPDADPQVIAREIVQRGWLTAFQVKMLWKNRGGELILNQYVLIDRLGEGGMGEVFRAKHRRMDRTVALKIIRKERLSSGDAVKRFQREIQASAHLAHENVVMAYDADQCGDRHFFAMEYVDGTNLARLVKENGPMAVKDACDCIRQAAIGLQHAHERGMVHRDIKPSNLLLSNSGVLKILDMGLARLDEATGAAAESRITQEGFVVGTPDYLAPEQARNARNADVRSDIYALGCTFYFLLMGGPPFKGDTPTEKLMRHTTEPVPSLPRPDLPPAVEGIVQRMMAKRPEDRFQTPAEIAFALQAYSGAVPPVATQFPTPLPFNPLTSTKQAAVDTVQNPMPTQEARQPSPYPMPLPERSPESEFRLPAPTPRQHSHRKRTRWNLPIAIAVGVVVLALIGGGIYLLVAKNKKESPSPTGGTSLDREYKNQFEMPFVLINTGTFEMGSNEAEDEGPVHAVEISKPFYMGATEVTLRQYMAVMGKDQVPKALRGKADDLDLPVNSITYEEVKAFLIRLNRLAEKKEGWEYRLPTEAEWEYSCRAGAKTRFHGGDDLTHEQALFGSSGNAPGKVAQFPANAWGLYDMHGNVAEWVHDKYDENYYKTSRPTDPVNTEPRRARNVVRGGGYNDPLEACRSSKRRGEYGDNFLSFPSVGFRVAIVQLKKQ